VLWVRAVARGDDTGGRTAPTLGEHARAALYDVLHPGFRVRGYRAFQDVVRGRSGLEVGGPSRLFRTRLPLYPVIGALDGVNFGDTTVWEGRLSAGRTFEWGGAARGEQYLCEASRLDPVPSGAYDFVLSSNCLEHVANPLAALAEWRRVTRPGGWLVLALPRRERTFDHRRPVTTMAHLLDDLRAGRGEDDLTHLEEILALHDLSRDPLAGTPEAFAARSRANRENRCLHHHVFDAALVRGVMEHAGYAVVREASTGSDHVALGRLP
jgi:SAM-dependent methyltransferase